jgi:hypothetical protein
VLVRHGDKAPGSHHALSQVTGRGSADTLLEDRAATAALSPSLARELAATMPKLLAQPVGDHHRTCTAGECSRKASAGPGGKSAASPISHRRKLVGAVERILMCTEGISGERKKQ